MTKEEILNGTYLIHQRDSIKLILRDLKTLNYIPAFWNRVANTANLKSINVEGHELSLSEFTKMDLYEVGKVEFDKPWLRVKFDVNHFIITFGNSTDEYDTVWGYFCKDKIFINDIEVFKDRTDITKINNSYDTFCNLYDIRYSKSTLEYCIELGLTAVNSITLWINLDGVIRITAVSNVGGVLNDANHIQLVSRNLAEQSILQKALAGVL